MKYNFLEKLTFLILLTIIAFLLGAILNSFI